MKEGSCSAMTIEGSGGSARAKTGEPEEERVDTGYHDARGDGQAADAELLVHGTAAGADQQRLHEEQEQPGRGQCPVRHHVKGQLGAAQAACSRVARGELR